MNPVRWVWYLRNKQNDLSSDGCYLRMIDVFTFLKKKKFTYLAFLVDYSKYVLHVGTIVQYGTAVFIVID